MSKIWNFIKKYNLTELSIVTIVLSLIYLLAWFVNGYMGMHFSLPDLITFYSVIVVKNLGSHTVDSVFNSQKGEMPKRENKDE
jgi:hypothetical protein